MNTSTLEHLAWAALSEEVIVARLAHKCVARGLSWEARGNKVRVREVIASVPTVRGDKARREKTVAVELERQREIRKKRRANRPINWGIYAQPVYEDRRRCLAERFFPTTHVGKCDLLRFVDNKLVMIVHADTSSRMRNHLVVVDRRTRQVLYRGFCEPVGDLDGLPSLSATLLCSFHPKDVEREVARGARIQFDFDNFQTVAHRADGTVCCYGWTSE